MARSLTATGAGNADFTARATLSGVQNARIVGSLAQVTRVGSLTQVTRVGTLQQATRVGSLTQVTRLGTLQQVTRVGSLTQVTRAGTLTQATRVGSLTQVTRLGTLQQVTRVGSLTQVTRAGTLAQATRVGSLTNVARVGSLTYLARVGSQGLQWGGSVFRANVPLGPGSTWIGSWQDVRPYALRTVAVRTLGGTPGGNGGSLSIIGGLTGTGVNGLTGTYHGPALVMRGSYTTYAVTDPLAYLRVFYRQSGYRRGTVSLGFARQA